MSLSITQPSTSSFFSGIGVSSSLLNQLSTAVNAAEAIQSTIAASQSTYLAAVESAATAAEAQAGLLAGTAGALYAGMNGLMFHVHAYGAVGDGVTDDSAAISAAFAAWGAASKPGRVVFENRDYAVSQPVSVNIARDQNLVIHGNGARFVYPPTFVGTAWTFTEMQTSNATTTEYQLPAITIKDVSFISTWAVAALNTAIRIQTQNGGTGQLGPSVDLENIRIQQNGAGGDWAFGIDLFGMNVTRSHKLYMHGVTGSASTLMRIDTDSRISVGHSVSAVVVTGGGTALQLGHAGATGPLQGVSVTDFNVGCTNGIVWNSASNADQLTVTNGQISCSGVGIHGQSLTSVLVSGVYFLQCGTGILLDDSSASGAVTSRRHSIVGSTFYAGPPIVASVPNYCIVVNGVNSGPDSGTVISGNTFTNLYGATTGTANASPIQIQGNSNYVTVVGNTVLGQVGVHDTSGNPNNYVGANLEGGIVNDFYFRSAPAFDNGLLLSGYPLAQNLWGSLTNSAGAVKLKGPSVTLAQNGGGLGFFDSGVAPGKQSVTGSVGSSTAATLKSLVSALAAYGLITDSTTA